MSGEHQLMVRWPREAQKEQKEAFNTRKETSNTHRKQEQRQISQRDRDWPAKERLEVAL